MATKSTGKRATASSGSSGIRRGDKVVIRWEDVYHADYSPEELKALREIEIIPTETHGEVVFINGTHIAIAMEKCDARKAQSNAVAVFPRRVIVEIKLLR